ncbi:hypothetical protein A2U01_0097937, partial [Trifolium medium]|nr:hypothetical protein [Trifolium medium]
MGAVRHWQKPIRVPQVQLGREARLPGQQGAPEHA